MQTQDLTHLIVDYCVTDLTNRKMPRTQPLLESRAVKVEQFNVARGDTLPVLIMPTSGCIDPHKGMRKNHGYLMTTMQPRHSF